MFIANSVLLGVGLAMDAFSVSMANGITEPHMSRRRMMAVAGVYAGFQFLMPMIGWICVRTIADYFTAFQKMIPWIALILLLYIGGKMFMEGIRGRNKEAEKAEEEGEELARESQHKIGAGTLFMQGIATSIDALSVGFTIVGYGTLMAVTASVIIAAVTFFICMGGLRIGRQVGLKLSSKASILGGVILIVIGIEIFVRG